MIKVELAQHSFHLLSCCYSPWSTGWEHVSLWRSVPLYKRDASLFLCTKFKHTLITGSGKPTCPCKDQNLFMKLPCWFVIACVFSQTSNLLVLKINSFSKTLDWLWACWEAVLITKCALALLVCRNWSPMPTDPSTPITWYYSKKWLKGSNFIYLFLNQAQM